MHCQAVLPSRLLDTAAFCTFLVSRVWAEGEAVCVGGELGAEAVLVWRHGM